VLRALYQWGRNNAADFDVEISEPLKLLDRSKP
jgi:hypothetical protein